MSKRAAVIGAGPSGLATVKELLEEGHALTCFERADGLGGVFRFGESDGVVGYRPAADLRRLPQRLRGPVRLVGGTGPVALGEGVADPQHFSRHQDKRVHPDDLAWLEDR